MPPIPEQGSLTFQSGLVYDVRDRDNVHVAARPPRPHLDHDVETAAPLILRQNPGSRFPKKAFAAVCERARRRLRVSTAVGDFSVSMAWNWHDTAVREAYPTVVAVWGTKGCSTVALTAWRGEVVQLDNASPAARRHAFHWCWCVLRLERKCRSYCDPARRS